MVSFLLMEILKKLFFVLLSLSFHKTLSFIIHLYPGFPRIQFSDKTVNKPVPPPPPPPPPQTTAAAKSPWHRAAHHGRTDLVMEIETVREKLMEIYSTIQNEEPNSPQMCQLSDFLRYDI